MDPLASHHVADDLSFHHIHDDLGHIGRVVGKALEGATDEENSDDGAGFPCVILQTFHNRFDEFTMKDVDPFILLGHLAG